MRLFFVVDLVHPPSLHIPFFVQFPVSHRPPPFFDPPRSNHHQDGHLIVWDAKLATGRMTFKGKRVNAMLLDSRCGKPDGTVKVKSRCYKDAQMKETAMSGDATDLSEVAAATAVHSALCDVVRMNSSRVKDQPFARRASQNKSALVHNPETAPAGFDVSGVLIFFWSLAKHPSDRPSIRPSAAEVPTIAPAPRFFSGNCLHEAL